MCGFLLQFLGLVSPPSCAVLNQTSYVEYVAGSTNVIISVPHGGLLLDPRIPDRQPGCFIDGLCVWDYDCTEKDAARCPVETNGDLNTIEITRLIAREFKKLTGKQPHLIINNLSRRQMDANKPKSEATGKNPIAGAVWDDFHGYLNYSRCLVKNGLYLDIHGHEHREGLVELGYTISGEQLNKGNFAPRVSSVGWAAGKTALNLITGGYSFGTLLTERGYDTMPSGEIPKPGKYPYIFGGYNVIKYGSLKGGEIDAIQVELPKYIRWEAKEQESFSVATAAVIRDYMDIRVGKAPRLDSDDDDDTDEDMDDSESASYEYSNSWFG